VNPEAQQGAQRAAQAVAKQYSATLAGRTGGSSAARRPGAKLVVRGQPIALEVKLMPQALPSAKRGVSKGVRPRLRVDRVAQRVLHDLESKLNPQLNDGRTIILTLGAPIRVASKLVATLTETLVSYLASGAAEVDVSKRMLGNRVRFRVMKASARWTPQLIGFVFSGDPSPGLLASTLGALHEAIADAPGRRASVQRAGQRWLALVVEDWIADFKTYQRACSKLAPPHGYDRILMVAANGRVEVLVEANQAGKH
jgi:hypothetical protein